MRYLVAIQHRLGRGFVVDIFHDANEAEIYYQDNIEFAEAGFITAVMQGEMHAQHYKPSGRPFEMLLPSELDHALEKMQANDR